MNRRRFVSDAIVISGLALVPILPSLAAPTDSPYSKASFEKLIGEEIIAVMGRNRLPLRVLAVKDATPVGEQFYVHFESGPLTHFDPGIYQLQHARVGTLDLYLDHCEQCEGTAKLVATVNRMA